MSNDDAAAIISLVVQLFAYLAMFGSFLVFWGIAYKVHPKNRVHMSSALEKLKTRWGAPVGVTGTLYGVSMAIGFVLYFAVVIVGVVAAIVVGRYGNSFAAGIIGFLFFALTPIMIYIAAVLGGPLITGFSRYFLLFNKNPETTKYSEMFAHYKGFDNMKRSGLTIFLWYLYLICWSLLFYIPGIIKAYSYSMTFYILADEPDLSPNEAITKSREMMDGHKAEYFWLICRFGGWYLLSMFTQGIGMLFLLPYLSVAQASFYEKLKAQRGGTSAHSVIEV